MRAIFGLGLAAAVLALVAGCSKKKGDGDDVGIPSDGSYVVVAMESGGDAAPDDEIAKIPEQERTLRVAGDKLIKGGNDSVAVRWDNTKRPGHVNFTETQPGGKTETAYGIYKLEGDTLTICMVVRAKEGERPTEFKTDRNSRAMLMTLKKK